MEQTFEEIVSRELGRLFSAALFMCGGNIARAQNGIVDALGRAASEYPPFLEDVPEWLEERVVLFCLESAAQERLPHASTPRGFPGGMTEAALRPVEPERFYAAASRLPPAARAVVWLVMFRRRAYGDVAALLGISRDELLQLLESRDAFLSELLRSEQRGSRNRTMPGA